MAGSNQDVTFEVYFCQNGTWRVQARHAEHKQAAAVQEAKALEKLGHIEGVKVVREAYDHDEGVSFDRIIYISPNLDEKKEVGSGGGSRSPSSGSSPSSGFGSPSSSRRTSSSSKSRRKKSRRSKKSARASSSYDDYDDYDDYDGPPKERVDYISFGFSKFFMIFIVSLAASSGITGLAFVGLPAVETETLYLVFLGSFLLSAVPTAFAVLP
ncbi:MAG: hypothetical protein ISR52_09380, partial [Rhodospirillales bacterium]|nr:hypothetical protein [Rhodospirillales bacterium]